MSDEETKKQEEMYKAHRERSEKIVEGCYFVEHPVTPNAVQAMRIIETIFEEATKEIMYSLPENRITAQFLEHMELACLLAKKSIGVHAAMLKSKEDENEERTNNN